MQGGHRGQRHLASSLGPGRRLVVLCAFDSSAHDTPVGGESQGLAEKLRPGKAEGVVHPMEHREVAFDVRQVVEYPHYLLEPGEFPPITSSKDPIASF